MSATIFEKQGSLLTVRPEGRLDTAGAPELGRELQPRLTDVQELIMDFERVEYISSAGIRILLTADQTVEEHGGSMKLIHVSDLVKEIFEVTGFVDILTIE